MPMICSRIAAFSLSDACINFGKSSANADRNEFSSCCPALFPCGSMTFRLLFLPFRSTISPLDNSTCKMGSVYAPSLAAAVGLYLSPPSAHAIASSTDVLPWLLLPPMMVKPFADGSSFTALIRLTFSISRLLIFTLIFRPPDVVVRLPTGCYVAAMQPRPRRVLLQCRLKSLFACSFASSFILFPAVFAG